MIRWTVVLPVFNERAFLPRTLTSLLAQSEPFELVLVDNGSTDGGIAAAGPLLARMPSAVRVLHEPRAGQVHALKRGIAAATGDLVAVCDADTWYPPHYLVRAAALFDRQGERCVAIAAYLLPERIESLWAHYRREHQLAALRLMPRQNHTSGAGQCFRRAALLASGGYDGALWPYVLKDHELMHRVLQLGTQAHDRDMWCVPSQRRDGARRGVRWTLGERLLYHVIPFRLKRRFFDDFLAVRFAARGLRDTVLRQRPWEAAGESL